MGRADIVDELLDAAGMVLQAPAWLAGLSCFPTFVPGACVGCSSLLPRKKNGDVHPTRRWCSAACSRAALNNHHWGYARDEAMLRNIEQNGGKCVKCPVQFDVDRNRLFRQKDGPGPEVNHIVPLRGATRGWSCMNHQENLEVVCSPCHKKITVEQQRDFGIYRGATAERRDAEKLKDWKDAVAS